MDPFTPPAFVSLPEVDSTNEYAKRLVSKNKPPEGTVIFASRQTSGKGQFGKSWESEPEKNLTCSVILYPVFLEARLAHLLNQIISLSLRDLMDALGISVKIKWPNDIYHHDKKLAGLLIENGLIGEHVSYSIAGIGLNVNQTRFSPDIPNPTSLKLISGKDFKLEKLLKKFLPFIEKRYLQLKTKVYAEIKSDYENSLYRLNEKARYRKSTEQFEGIICGVSDEGQLKMQVSGTIRLYSTNEIIYL
ncbi:MAG TPA: biotin--[acetyl-CoA-carboxylase] ligase [Chitinophagales bacterium]|nr:biotin--[acetyl-CoA-carboxylase] ligase [Chitinophagales bacterium]